MTDMTDMNDYDTAIKNFHQLHKYPYITYDTCPDYQRVGGHKTVGHIAWKSTNSNTSAGFAFAFASHEDQQEFGPSTYRFNDPSEKNNGYIFKIDFKKGRVMFLDQGEYLDHGSVVWADSAKIERITILDDKLLSKLPI